MQFLLNLIFEKAVFQDFIRTAEATAPHFAPCSNLSFYFFLRHWQVIKAIQSPKYMSLILSQMNFKILFLHLEKQCLKQSFQST